MTIKTMTTVFLDSRSSDQKEEEEKQKQLQLKEQEDKKQEQIELGGKVLGFIIKPILFMLLWNYAMPSLFAIATINYFQSVAFYMMFSIIGGAKK